MEHRAETVGVRATAVGSARPPLGELRGPAAPVMATPGVAERAMLATFVSTAGSRLAVWFEKGAGRA